MHSTYFYTFGVFIFMCSALHAQNETADPFPVHGPTKAMRAYMKAHNDALDRRGSRVPYDAVVRPFAEYEETGYIIMSATNSYEAKAVKRTIAQNLPKGVDFVIFTQRQTESSIRQFFRPYLEDSRLHIVPVKNLKTSFWARDNLPIPVFHENETLGLVDHKYYYNFEPDLEISNFFGVTLSSHQYYYEGGNFLPDTRGNCMTVGNQLSNTVYRNYYGCKNITRFRQIGGIGHIDERVKLLSDTVALTDTAQFKTQLESLDYKVHLLPRLTGYKTYVNSLLIHDTIFVPIYGKPSDQKAIDVYKKMGLKVFPVRTNSMSNSGRGSIHCITMTYPKVDLDELLARLSHL